MAVLDRELTNNEKKNRKYWIDRHIEWITVQNENDDDYFKTMARKYMQTQKEIENEVAAYFQMYGKDNVIEYRQLLKDLSKEEKDLLIKNIDEFVKQNPQLEHLVPVRESIYKLNRLQGLEYSIWQKNLQLGLIEEKELKKHLKKTYGKHYKDVMREFGYGQSFDSINDTILNMVIRQKWINGENYSDRIWTNKLKLTGFMNKELTDALIRGVSYQKTVDLIRKRFDVGENEALRLVYTESSFVLNQAHKDAYNQAGIKRYELVAIMDSRTSDICRDMDGKMFDMDKAQVGVNFPPFHPYCRTTFISDRPDRIQEEIEENDVREEIKQNASKSFDQFSNAEELKEDFNEYLENMSDDDLTVYKELSRFKDTNNYNYRSGGAHYDPSTNKVNMYLGKPSDFEIYTENGKRGSFKTMFHEEFHQLDALLSRTPLAKHYATDEMLPHLRLTAMDSKHGKDMFNAINDDILNFINMAIDHQNEKRGTETKHLKSLSRISRDANYATIDYLREHYPERSDHVEILAFTDTLGGATGGRIDVFNSGFYGHRPSYYKNHGDEVAALEAWAEYGEYLHVYTEEQQKEIKKLLPKTIEVNDKVYKEIVEYLKENKLTLN